MRLEFDPDKDLLNRLKHGISLGEARSLDWENAIESIDDRHEYGEKRKRAVGLLRGRLYLVVFVIRGNVRRIISLRKANAREVRDYEHETRNHLSKP